METKLTQLSRLHDLLNNRTQITNVVKCLTQPESYPWNPNEFDASLGLIFTDLSKEIQRIFNEISSNNHNDNMQEDNEVLLKYLHNIQTLKNSLIASRIIKLQNIIKEFEKSIQIKINGESFKKLSVKLRNLMITKLHDKFDKIKLLYEGFYTTGNMMFQTLKSSNLTINIMEASYNALKDNYNQSNVDRWIDSVSDLFRIIDYSFLYHPKYLPMHVVKTLDNMHEVVTFVDTQNITKVVGLNKHITQFIAHAIPKCLRMIHSMFQSKVICIQENHQFSGVIKDFDMFTGLFEVIIKGQKKSLHIKPEHIELPIF